MSESRYEGKSYVIPEQLLWDAWLKVKEKGGSAGADGVTIQQFEQGREESPVRAVESHVVGVVFPRSGPGGGYTQEARFETARHTKYR